MSAGRSKKGEFIDLLGIKLEAIGLPRDELRWFHQKLAGFEKILELMEKLIEFI